MKLISLHITNFGKLSNFDYSFNEDLNIINECNGWGKTTLADFIKAMLYSLPATRARNLKENLRKKYKPWNGGEFGGNLRFEVNSEEYKVERTFGSTESEDTFKLISLKTNKESKAYSSDLGYEIFGLDSESFSKTTYLPQLDLKTNLTDNISAKLNNLTQDKDDVNSFNNAIKVLDENRKIYQKTGERGKLYEVKRELEKIELEKQTLVTLTKSIDELENKKSSLKENIGNLELKEKELNQKINNTIQQEKHKNIKKIKTEIEDLENNINNIKLRLNGTLPSNNELQNKQKQIESQIALEQNIAHLKSQKESLENEFKYSNQFFGDSKLTDERISDINSAYSAYVETKNSNQNSDLTISSYSTKKANVSTWIYLSLFAIACVLCITLFVLSIIDLVFFAIFLGLIVLSIVTISIVALKSHKKSKSNSITQLNNIKNKEQELENLLSFNYKEDLDIQSKYIVFKNNLDTYNNINIKLNGLETKLNELLSKHEKIQSELYSFIDFYKNTVSASNASELIFNLSKLTSSYEQYSNLLIKKQDEYTSASKDIDLNKMQIESSEYNLDDLNRERTILTDSIKELQEELASTNIALERYKLKFDELEELSLRENELNEELQKITNKLYVIETTDKYLKLAKEELDSAFIKPIADNFAELVQKLAAYDIENFNIDTDFNISIDHNGQTKEISFFSKGYQDLSYICARFSSIKAMFKKEKPFIILDDPFVNLDAEKLNLAKTLLKELSKDYQILYLVCHNSRA